MFIFLTCSSEQVIMTMDEFSWSLVYRSLRTDDIHIGDVQVRDEHEKDEVIRHIFLVPCSMPVPWTSHLPSFSSLDDLFGRHKTWDFPYAISCPLVHIGRPRDIIIKYYFPWISVLGDTCHHFIGCKSRRFIFSRRRPRVIIWLVESFHIPKSAIYK